MLIRSSKCVKWHYGMAEAEAHIPNHCEGGQMLSILHAAGMPLDLNVYRFSDYGLLCGKRQLARAKLDTIRWRSFEICLALQSFRLPAFITLQIIDWSWNVLADLVPMYLKWELITKIKHWKD